MRRPGRWNGGPFVSGSSIYMYAVGSGGYGSSPASLLQDNGTGTVQVDSNGNGFVTTDANGSFTLTGLYPKCPSPDSMVYLMAVGGNPGLSGSISNSALVDVSALPLSCSLLPQVPNVYINEATTVAAAYALGSFTSSSINAISTLGLPIQALSDAFGYANTLVDSLTGKVQASNVPQQAIDTLSNILGTCVSSTGAYPGSSCSKLFALTGSASPSAIANVWQAALAIAYNPTNNVDAIYVIAPAIVSYVPQLSSPPANWNLAGPVSPSINNLNPEPAVVGATLQILGSGFGGAQGTNAVIVGGVVVPVISWTNTEIDVTVPSGITAGYVQIYVDGYGSNIVALQVNVLSVTQTTLSLTPATSTDGNTVTANVTVSSVSGIPSGIVTCLNDFGIASGMASLGANGTVQIPLQGLPPGADAITCTFNSSQGFASSFAIQTETVNPAPPTLSINSVNSKVAGSSVTLTINGQDFGSSGSVTIPGEQVTTKSWSNGVVVVSITPVTYSGNITLTNSVGAVTGAQFNIVLPVVTGLSIYEGPTGIGLVISGTGFRQNEITATIGSTVMPPIATSNVSPTSIAVTIPANATTGIVDVTLSNGATSVSNSLNTFTVIPQAGCVVSPIAP